MLYKLEVPGFEGQRLEIDAGAFKKTLLFNGVTAPSAGIGKYRITRDDGREVTTKWTSSFDPAPSIVIDGQTIRTAAPLKWHEILLVGLPFLLVFVGGALGGLLGGVAATFNAKLIRSSQPAAVRYIGSIAVAAVAAVLYLLVAGALRLYVLGDKPGELT
jgi:hypothetical protein